MAKLIKLIFMLATAAQAQNFYADAVIAHMPDGCVFPSKDAWRSTVILLNPTARPVSFSMKFWPKTQDPEKLQYRRISVRSKTTDQYTLQSEVSGTLAPNEQYVLETSGEFCKAAPFTEMFGEKNDKIGVQDLFGWAEVSSQDVLAGYVIMTQTAGSITDVTVPFSSRFANSFVVPFDSSGLPLNNPGGFTSSIALVNPSFDTDAYVNMSFLYDGGGSCEVKSQLIKKGQQFARSLKPADGFDGLDCLDIAGQRGVVQVRTVSQGSNPAALELSGFVLRFRKGGGIVSLPGQAPVGR